MRWKYYMNYVEGSLTPYLMVNTVLASMQILAFVLPLCLVLLPNSKEEL